MPDLTYSQWLQNNTKNVPDISNVNYLTLPFYKENPVHLPYVTFTFSEVTMQDGALPKGKDYKNIPEGIITYDGKKMFVFFNGWMYIPYEYRPNNIRAWLLLHGEL